jgi:hypothetical protein
MPRKREDLQEISIVSEESASPKPRLVGFIHFLGVIMFIYVFLAQNTVRRSFQRKKRYSHVFLLTVEIYRERWGRS